MTLENIIDVEIYVTSTVDGPGWFNIADDPGNYVLTDGAEAITITVNSNPSSTTGLPEPSECRMTWNVSDGLLWPGNPLSVLSPSLGLNTQLRVLLRVITHSFPGTVVDDWSDVGGYPVVNTGAGGSVLASDFQQTPGIATHSIPTTSAWRMTTLDGFLLEDCEQSIEFRITSNVTGGGIEAGNLVFRDTGTDRRIVRVVANADETITVKWLLITGAGEFDLTDAVTVPVVNTGQWITVQGNVENGRFQAKVYDSSDLEPLDWAADTDINTWTEQLFPGTIGVRSGVASGNTNTKPVVVEYRNWRVRSGRFFGQITEYPLEVDETGESKTVEIVAAGITRQLTQGDQPALSTLARAVPDLPGLQAYWRMEDPAGSGAFASALPGQPPMIPLRGTPGYAEFSTLTSSSPIPTGNQSDWIGDVLPYTDTGVLQVSFVLNLPAGGQSDLSILCRWYTDHPTARMWQLTYRTGGDFVLQAAVSEESIVYQSSTIDFNLDGGNPRLVVVQLSNNGADVDWEVHALDMVAGGSATASGTATGRTLSVCNRVWFNLNLQDTLVFGHCFVLSVLLDALELSDEADAWDFEFLETRLERLLAELGVPSTFENSEQVANQRMGPQRPRAIGTLLAEPVTFDAGGKWYDGRTYPGIAYRDRTSLYAQKDPWITVSYTGQQVMKPWSPRIDDRDIRNRVTVSREDGSEGTFELASGPNSVLPPDQGGVGPYATQVTVNAYNDDLLQQMAAFRVALGTQEGPRFPSVIIELGAAAVAADPTIRDLLLDMRPGRTFAVDDATPVFQYDLLRQVCNGYRENLSRFLHSFTLNGEPRGAFDVYQIEDTTWGRFDSGSSTLAEAITSSQATIPVTSTGSVWGTGNLPFDIRVGGERMTVTDINALVPAYVATGTASHVDNTSATPGVPGGGTVAGNDMLMITRGRAQAANDPASWGGGSGTGWTLAFPAAGTFKVFRKVHTGSESAPTVTWPAGAAGDVNSAVTTSWSDLGDYITSVTTSVGGGGSQNIPFLTLQGVMPDGVAIITGAKADDWTSVATLTGATEIVDSPTTVGNDHGLVADYILHNGSSTGVPTMTVTPGEFVVTGGVAAPNRSLVMMFGNPQQFDVTRDVNNAGNSHPAGTAVRTFYQPRYAL